MMHELVNVSLYNKLKDIQNPEISIIVDGCPLNLVQDLLFSVDVKLTCGFEASSCILTIVDKNAKLQNLKVEHNKLLDTMKIGGKVIIGLGYGKDIKPVFIGALVDLDCEVKPVGGSSNCLVVYTVICMDVKYMMMHGRKTENYLDKSMGMWTTVVQEFGSRYSKWGVFMPPMPPATVLQKNITQDNESDYEFVVRNAKKQGYLFYVCQAVVYLKSYSILSSAQTPMLVVDLSSNMLISQKHHLTLESQISEQIYKIVPLNTPGKMSEVKERVSPRFGRDSNIMNLSTVLGTRSTDVYIDYNSGLSGAASGAKAAKWWKALDSISGELKMYGMHTVFPGAFMQLNGADKNRSGTYLIRDVEHVFDKNGFYTTIKYCATS